MPSSEVKRDARLHTTRNDPDRRATTSDSPCPYRKATSVQTCACAGACYYAPQAQREATSRDQSLDGLHSEQARQEVARRGRP